MTKSKKRVKNEFVFQSFLPAKGGMQIDFLNQDTKRIKTLPRGVHGFLVYSLMNKSSKGRVIVLTLDKREGWRVKELTKK